MKFVINNMAFAVNVWKSLDDTKKLSIKKKSYSTVSSPFSRPNKEKKSSSSNENNPPKEIQHKYIGFVTL